MSTIYPILQSGYLALSSQGLNKKKPQTSSFADQILYRPTNHDYDNLHYSVDITELFNVWRANPHAINNHEFRSKVMRQALTHFGPSISEWILFQAQKPGFSFSHRQFLEKFVNVLLPHELDVTQTTEVVRWVGLLGPMQGQRQSFVIQDYTMGMKFPEQTTDALVNMASRVGGYPALLNFMFVIFGERTGFIQSTGGTEVGDGR